MAVLNSKAKEICTIQKLKRALQKIKEGDFVHIACVRSVRRWIKSDDLRLVYAKFLVNTSFELYKADESLSVEKKLLIQQNVPCTKFYLNV